MSNVLDTLEERGFVYQTTDDPDGRRNLRELLDREGVTAYVGIDPTAPSLHVGHLVSVMALVHLQRGGHRPIAIVGGGTGMVGDPSGKTEMRKLLDAEAIDLNVVALRDQLARFLDFSEDEAFLFNNAEWIADLNYLEFLRDIGRHFSVNRMLSHDCFKIRFESHAGLSFLEFNYMLLQAYDFLVLFRERGCQLQIGGSDQWGNIVAGVELIRRVEGKEAHGLTIPLLMTPAGKKMGKTEKGAVWLDAKMTSPYEYYQYWVNTDDSQVGQLLRFFTLLDLDTIAGLERLRGADVRRAKETLALEATRLAHGDDEAERAQKAARALFGGGATATGEVDMPTHTVEAATLASGVPVFVVCADGKLCGSRAEARRLARQGGLYLNGEAVAEDRVLTEEDLDDDGSLLLRAGKKRYLKVLRG